MLSSAIATSELYPSRAPQEAPIREGDERRDSYLLWNQSRPSTPPIPRSSLNMSVIGIPAYNSSWPLSSQILVINEAGLRMRPSSWNGNRMDWAQQAYFGAYATQQTAPCLTSPTQRVRYDSNASVFYLRPTYQKACMIASCVLFTCIFYRKC